MIICFEGPSAIGKTTLCALLKEHFAIVDEVNLLFQKEENNSKFWYLEKQVERFKLAKNASKNAILDGDIFQPIWYNWIYGFPSESISCEETKRFFLEHIILGNIAFPDLYIVFETEMENLFERKKNDATRKRRNFEKHLEMILPQKNYFKFIQEKTAIPVQFINYENLQKTKENLLEFLATFKPNPKDDKVAFEIICKWVKFNEM